MKNGVQNEMFSVALDNLNSLTSCPKNWSIRSRCTWKGKVNHSANSKGKGQLINLQLREESSSRRKTGFRNLSLDLDKGIEVGKFYRNFDCTVKKANAQYNEPSSFYEIILSQHSEFSNLILLEYQKVLNMILSKFWIFAKLNFCLVLMYME